MKKGLVLEGGAMRGMFSAGIMDVMLEEGIYFDGIVGVSAGAVFGCNYKSKQIGRTIRYNTKYCKDPRFCSVRSLIKTGDMFGKDFCYRQIPFELDVFDTEAFKANPAKFYVVVTDVVSGTPIYKEIKNADEKDLEWMRASASLPLVSKIVKADGKELLDGGISDSIPLKFFIDKGYDKNIVILTQPKGYVKSKNKLTLLFKVLFRKYPNLIKAMNNRHIVYNSQTEYTEQEETTGTALILRPSEKLPVGRIEKNPDILWKTYEIGRQTGKENLERIKEYLEI